MKRLTIQTTIAQLEPVLGDAEANRGMFERVLQRAKMDGADLVLLPELFATGYSVGPMLDEQAMTLDGEAMRAVRALVREYGLYVVWNFPERNGTSYYITSALIGPSGDVLGTYRKMHLFDGENEYFTSGDAFVVVDTPIGAIGLMICYDVEFPEVARSLMLNDADMLLISNANMHPYARHHELYAQARAMENEIPVVICNRVGREPNLRFCGGSMAIDAKGNVLVQAGEQETIVTIDVPLAHDLDPAVQYRMNRKPCRYGGLTN